MMRRMTIVLLASALMLSGCLHSSDKNQPPLAKDISVTMNSNTSMQIDVLAQASDADGDPLSLVSVSSPQHGTAVITGSQVLYTPSEDFAGNDSFHYTVKDGKAEAFAAVHISVIMPNRAPEAKDVAASTANNQPVTIDVIANSTDPDGDKLQLIWVGEASSGVTRIEDNKVIYTPTTGFAGTDRFSYLMTDGEFEASAEVQLTVTQELTLSGRVIDSPIARATVSVQFGEQQFTAVADDEGYYKLAISILDMADNSLPRLRAQGSAEQAYVTLSARLPAAANLVARSGDSRSLDREILNETQLTQLTTARDIQLVKIAGDRPLTSESLAELDGALDPQLVLEMAAAIKLLVDDPKFMLPEGYNTIEDFVMDEDAYNAFVAAASEGGDNSPLAQAIQATVNDPDVTPALSAADLVGDYVRVTDSVPFMLSGSYGYLKITEQSISMPTPDGTGHYRSEARSWKQVGSELVIADPQREGFSSSQSFSSIHSLTDDQSLIDAWLSRSVGNLVPVNRFSGVDKFIVLSVSERDLMAQLDTFSRFEDFSFEVGGQTYTIPGKTVETTSQARFLRTKAARHPQLTFEVEAESQWLLPTPLGVHYTDLFTLHADGRFSGATDDVYGLSEEQHLAWQATREGKWQLSDDKRALTLVFDQLNPQAQVTLYWHRDTAPAIGMLAEFSNAEGEGFTAIGNYMDLRTGATAESFVAHADNSFMLSMLNNQSSALWQGSRLLPNSGWFGWQFAPDGTGKHLPQFLCDGRELDWRKVCHGEFTLDQNWVRPITWKINENLVVIERASQYWFDRGYCERGLPCHSRIIAPQVSGAHGIITGIEYQLTPARFGNSEAKPGEQVMMILPRVVHWLEAKLPGAADAVGGNGANDARAQAMRHLDPLGSYQRVLRQPQPPMHDQQQ